MSKSSVLVPTRTIVTLRKSETYKETIKEKSTILVLPYSIHKRIHVPTRTRTIIVTLGKSETYKETRTRTRTRTSVTLLGLLVPYYGLRYGMGLVDTVPRGLCLLLLALVRFRSIRPCKKKSADVLPVVR